RNYGVRLAIRPLGQPPAARLVLRAARAVAAVSAVRARDTRRGAVGFRRILWTRLDRHRATHREARDGRIRRRTRAGDVRVDRRWSSGRRGADGAHRWLGSQDV